MEITSDLIEQSERELEIQNIQYRENQLYVKGLNPPILTAEAKEAPDNRIPGAFAKMSVEDMSGFAGRAENIKVRFVPSTTQSLLEEIKGTAKERTEEDEKEQKLLNDLYKLTTDHNRDSLEVSELYYNGNTQGSSYELWWVSDDLKLPKGMMTPEYKKVPNNQGFLIWDNSLKPNLEAFLHFYEIGDLRYCDVYKPGEAEIWVKKEGAGNYTNTGEVKTYPYKRVPVAIFATNEDALPLFQAEKPLIDAMDKIVSVSQNEIDRFNALLLLLPAEVQKEFVDKINELHVMDDLQGFERWPEYLEKNLSMVNEFYKWAHETLENIFRKSIKIPDMSDENFSGQQSGIAMAFKLLGMEFKAALIETYFNLGFHHREDLFKDVINASQLGIKTEAYTIEIKSKRNLPIDDAAKIEMATKLMSLVSRETILKFLPESIVSDVEGEIKKLDEGMDNLITDSEGVEDIKTEIAGVVLNGAQITAAQEIVEKVALGQLPRKQAIELILLLGVPRAVAEKIVPLESEANAAKV